MSLDFSLTRMEPVDVFWQNYTHNVTPMWREAGVYDALYMSHGKQAKEIIAELRAGVDAMKADPAKYEALNPENGWGRYETALPWLEAVLAACEDNPELVIEVSK